MIEKLPVYLLAVKMYCMYTELNIEKQAKQKFNVKQLLTLSRSLVLATIVTSELSTESHFFLLFDILLC